jgi:hypothetical protein
MRVATSGANADPPALGLEGMNVPIHPLQGVGVRIPQDHRDTLQLHSLGDRRRTEPEHSRAISLEIRPHRRTLRGRGTQRQ